MTPVRNETSHLYPHQLYAPWEWAGVEMIREGLALRPDAALWRFDASTPRLRGRTPRDVLAAEGPERGLLSIARAVEEERRERLTTSRPGTSTPSMRVLLNRLAPWTRVSEAEHETASRMLVHRLIAAITRELAPCADAEVSALLRTPFASDVLVLLSRYVHQVQPPGSELETGPA